MPLKTKEEMSYLRGHLGPVRWNLAPSSLVPQLTYGKPLPKASGLGNLTTPHLMQIPIIKAKPYPRHMLRKPPKKSSFLAALPRTTWEHYWVCGGRKTTKNSKTFSLLTCATAPSPKRTRAKVPRVSAKNSRTYLMLSVVNVFKLYLIWFDMTIMTKYFSLVCFHLEPSFILHLYRIFLFRFCKRAAC